MAQRADPGSEACSLPSLVREPVLCSQYLQMPSVGSPPRPVPHLDPGWCPAGQLGSEKNYLELGEGLSPTKLPLRKTRFESRGHLYL